MVFGHQQNEHLETEVLSLQCKTAFHVCPPARFTESPLGSTSEPWGAWAMHVQHMVGSPVSCPRGRHTSLSSPHVSWTPILTVHW